MALAREVWDYMVQHIARLMRVKVVVRVDKGEMDVAYEAGLTPQEYVKTKRDIDPNNVEVRI